MALIKPIHGEMSGKIGGNVYAKNRGGQYVRQWRSNTNPNTQPQQSARTALSSLVTAWQTELTDAQRQGWDSYGKNVAMTNRLGDVIYLTGQNHYVRSNSPRIIAGVARVDDAPTAFNLGTLNPCEVELHTGPSGYAVIFDDTQDWVNDDGSVLIVQDAVEVSPTRNFFKGPFVFNSGIEGDSSTPPTSPAIYTPTHPMTEGNASFVRVRLSQADGRLSSPQILRGIILS